MWRINTLVFNHPNTIKIYYASLFKMQYKYNRNYKSASWETILSDIISKCTLGYALFELLPLTTTETFLNLHIHNDTNVARIC